MNSRAPDTIDLFIAGRLRLRRKDLRWSMQQLAGKLGVSVQQVQKYESGANRISAGRLYEAARVMRVPFAYFVEGFAALNRPAGMHEEGEPFVMEGEGAPEIAVEDETRVLSEAFRQIIDPDVRQALLTLATSWSLNGQRPHDGAD